MNINNTNAYAVLIISVHFVALPSTFIRHVGLRPSATHNSPLFYEHDYVTSP
jgi:hypothetical protein